MKHYFINLWLWLKGFTKFGEVEFEPGWTAKQPKWWFLYLVDYGINVIFLAGQVETISRHAEDHRSGWFWGKLLDLIEKFDKNHGPRSGPPLWDSVLPPKWVRIVVPLAWTVLAISVFF
jgi:hypothetical protein